MPLQGKAARHLRALAHHLEPVVLVGTSGLTEALLAKVSEELENHELIKVKMGPNSPIQAKEAAPRLEEATGGQVAQVIGKTVVLYRARKEDPEIVLPD